MINIERNSREWGRIWFEQRYRQVCPVERVSGLRPLKGKQRLTGYGVFV
ncbi:MAG: hypothetical protein JSV88_21905 [Candidatus Aminicenantes bacterium]|nr:MAG: hypothetical protein JSV88_21905 [Candidatus Aminicenantes bacterium]